MLAEDLPKSSPAAERDGLSVVAADGLVRVRIGGEVDLARFREIEEALLSADVERPPILEIDLSGVTFMDSQGLRLLLQARERAAIHGRRLVLVGPSPFVLRLFDIAGLGEVFEIDGRSSANAH